MSDRIRVRLGCSDPFAPRARYVLETFAAVRGIGLEYVGRDALADIAYGDASHDGCPAIAEAPDDPIVTAFAGLALLHEETADRDAWGRALPAGRDLVARPVDAALDAVQALVEDGRRARGEEPLRCEPLVSDARFALALTHDIDGLRYFAPYRAARLGRELASGRVGEATAALQTLARGRIGRRDPHARLDQVAALEAERGATSTFYFLAEQRHRLDGRDRRHYRRALPAAAATVRDAGAEIGVHGSTSAAASASDLALQRASLARIAGVSVNGNRFHNLRFDMRATPSLLADAGIAHDSTVGFAAVEGFRAGTTFPYALYDVARDRATDVIEVPLAVMDTTFRSARYQGLSSGAAVDASITVLEQTAGAGGAVSLLWHNDNLDDRLAEGYGTTYRRILDWMVAAGGRGLSTGAVAEAYRLRLDRARTAG